MGPKSQPEEFGSNADFQQIKEDLADLDENEVDSILNSEEKRFLLYVERGDVASVKQ